MSIEEQNVAVMRAVLQSWNDGTIATEGARFAAPGFVRHDLNGAGLNVADVHRMPSADYHRMLSVGLAEMHLEIVDIFAVWDRVCVRFVGSGIHRGEFLGVPPTGKRVEWNGINTYRLVDGKIVETWQLADHLGILRQMGTVSVAPTAHS